MGSDRFEGLDEFALLHEDAAEFGIPWDGSPTPAREACRTRDGEVSLVRWGSGQPRLVFLHGGALNAHTWNTVALALRRPMLALDLPGHGDSPWRPDGRYGPDTLAPAVAEVIRAHAAPPVTLVGHSLGGLAGIALAGALPELVSGLVLVDVLPVIANAEQVRSFLAGPEVFSSREEIVTRARAFGFGHSDEAVARGVWHNTRVRDDGTVVWKHHLGNFGPGQRPPLDPAAFVALWPALESFPGPVLLVRGERGFLSDDNVAELRRRVPAATVVTTPTGHNVQEQDPVLLAKVVAEFLGVREDR
jgi:pimeloyl-ACP methyl ester carboxylesterase